jgi:RNA polymerase sigma factor (TIGR02999 family)
MDEQAQPPQADLTLWLEQARAGDGAAAERVFRRLYPELLRIAGARLRGPSPPTLLDTEALVHECYLRFVSAAPAAPLQGRKHFFSLASKIMRHIVVDFVRSAQAQRRGGDWQRQTWDTALLGLLPDSAPLQQLSELDEALHALETLDPALAELVELRFYGGYTEPEAAQALGLSERTLRRQWAKARAFLLDRLG